MEKTTLLDAYLSGPGILRAAVTGISREQMVLRPVAGRWSVLEVVSHLADTDANITHILRRVERAKQLLQAEADLSLAEVALRAGFSDQSQFSRHFKRLVGVTPRQFGMSARIA